MLDIKIQVDVHLEGTKQAFLFSDNVLLVSPAMAQLIKAEDADGNLEWIMANIPIKRLPFPANQGLPDMDFMTTEKPQ